MTIAHFQIEFDRMIGQLKSYKIGLSDPVLAYRALKSENLSEGYENIVMTTVSEITLNSMILKFPKVMTMEKQRTVAEISLDIEIKKELDLALFDAPEHNGPQEGVYYSYGNYRKLFFYPARGRRAVRYRGRGNIRGQKFRG